MVNAVADGDDLMEALDLNTEDLRRETPESMCKHIPARLETREKTLLKTKKLQKKNVNSCAR